MILPPLTHIFTKMIRRFRAFCNLLHLSEFIRQRVPSKQFQTLLRGLVFAIFAVSMGFLVLLTVSGTIAPWSGRFYSLWDTGYAKIHIPIIASVSEHQPTAWPAFFFDLNMMIWLFPAGVYMCFQNLKDEHVFVVIYCRPRQLLRWCHGPPHVDLDPGRLHRGSSGCV